MTKYTPGPAEVDVSRRAGELFAKHLAGVHRRTDRLFAGLLAAEWAAAVAAAAWLTPFTWAGLDSRTHPHVWAAVVLGLAVVSLPIILAVLRPGEVITRHVIAIGQMLMGALLIHLTGGRIETHFHVFGSLAFLAFYRDWRVLISGSVVVALDHAWRGFFWPESVYGVAFDSGWRWLEHAGWVAFEDAFLILSCLRGVAEMRGTAERQARLEGVNAVIETAVGERTAELARANNSLRQEIAERSRAEQALHESEDRYRCLVDVNPDGILVHREGAIAFANPAAVQLLGAERPEQLVGRPVSDFVPTDAHDRVGERFRRLEELGEPVPFVEEKMVRLNGQAFDAEVGGAPFPDRGRRAAVVIIRDMSTRKQLEEQFRQSQKMEAVGKLAGGVAHDFNNLLTVITGYTEMVLSETPAGDPAASTLAEVHAAGVQASNLTRQLLAFSRKTLLQPRVLDPNDLVANLQRMLGRLIGEDIRLTTCLGPAVGRVRVDPGQIEQVIVNLAVNARDAMPQGGSLNIETAAVDLDEAYARSRPEVRPGRYVMLAVSDTGRGMTEDVKAHIFEPFFTTKGPGEGTGLGLATVYGIVKQSGGHVSVYSELGRGTTFKVFLPVADGAANVAASAAPKAPAPGGRETVLLVEDEARVRGLTAAALRKRGYVVVEAGCAEEALRARAALPGPIDLLLTDVVMPGASGRVLAERLTASDPTLAVLYMSGYTDDAVVRHGLLSAEVEFLQKPFAVDALLRTVRRVLDRRPDARPVDEPSAAVAG
jgi:PAS domain S-box-containing protein